METKVEHKKDLPRVLHIASGDLWAGAEAQLYTLVKTLHLMGAPICVVLLNYGKLEKKLIEKGIKVTVIDEQKLNSFQILLRLIHIIRDQSPDIIHTHRIKENILGSTASLISGRIPSLRTVHGAPEYRPSKKQIAKRLNLYLNWFCGRFMQRKIVAVSQDLGDILKENFPSSQVQIIANGIDVDGIISQTQPVNRKSGTSETCFRIGLAGRLVSIKKINIFISTARYMLDHYPDIQVSFHIFGDGPLRDNLIKFSQEQKTEDIVSFEGHCDNMAQALLDIDVLLMTSDHEGLPMILLEAMALQVPIIAHATGGIPELLDQGSCGILVRKHSAEGYGEELYRLLTNQSMYKNIQKKALARVTASYSAEENARAYLSQYSLITKHKKTIHE